MADLDGLGYRDAVAVVTGGSSGMGEATGRLLSELGAQVHVVDLNAPSYPHAAFHETDVSDPAQVSATARALRDAGPLRFFFSCAGISHTFGPLKVMLVNYVGARQLMDEVLAAIPEGGAIAIISSQAGMAWQQNLPANRELLAIADPVEARKWCEANPEKIKDGYSVSKEMLITWAMHECVALGARRIRVNCTAPCPTDTAFMVPTVAALGKEFFERYPYPLLGRMATPEEQAWPLILLNSPLNAVITGTVVYTDQGYTGGLWTGSLDTSAMMAVGEG